ncbi:MAG: hypothetical protein M3Q29_06475 [Chloroflexota bacterium]|nr:hypothetical protein [Chloroflexota bacterium]
MSKGPHRLNVCEHLELACEESEWELTQIMRLSPDPQVDLLAEKIRARLAGTRERAKPAGQLMRRVRQLAQSDDWWLPPDGAGAMAIPEGQEEAA